MEANYRSQVILAKFSECLRGYPETPNGQCDADFGREQGDAEEAILGEACPEAVTRLQAKRFIAMAIGSFRIASSPGVGPPQPGPRWLSQAP
jgi:hypothetical protein